MHYVCYQPLRWRTAASLPARRRTAWHVPALRASLWPQPEPRSWLLLHSFCYCHHRHFFFISFLTFFIAFFFTCAFDPGKSWTEHQWPNHTPQHTCGKHIASIAFKFFFFDAICATFRGGFLTAPALAPSFSALAASFSAFFAAAVWTRHVGICKATMSCIYDT